MRALISGGTGFAGSHLARFLIGEGVEVSVFSKENGASVEQSEAKIKYFQADICDADAVTRIFEQTLPHEVYHLAAVSAVPVSWQSPHQVLETNVIGTFNIFEAGSRMHPSPRILNVSSSQVYGGTNPGVHPLNEKSPIKPANLYASSKAMAEILSSQYLDQKESFIINARPFNHTGPGQSREFVLSTLACQVAEAEAGIRTTIQTGDLSVTRDFTDVRDVVRAYRLLLRSGRNGEAYNICSGVERRLSTAFELLQSFTQIKVQVEVDSSRLRPNEARQLFGDPSKIQREVGWKATIPFESTIRDLLDYWRARTKGNLAASQRPA